MLFKPDENIFWKEMNALKHTAFSCKQFLLCISNHQSHTLTHYDKWHYLKDFLGWILHQIFNSHSFSFCIIYKSFTISRFLHKLCRGFHTKRDACSKISQKQNITGIERPLTTGTRNEWKMFNCWIYIIMVMFFYKKYAVFSSIVANICWLKQFATTLYFISSKE